MLPAKNGTRICCECGRQFMPAFPDTGGKWDETCEMCRAMLDSPAWYSDDAPEEQKEETA